jgi:hypothetical protein
MTIALATAMSASAKDYQDNLKVIVNGVASNQMANISVTDLGNDHYTLSLKNFVLISGDQALGIGNITLENVAGTTVAGKTTISTRQTININEGDQADIAVWTGPLLGPIPVELTAELADDKLYTIIDIDMMANLGQIIKVVFGNGGYQIPNAGFEKFHSVGTNYVEPDAWHSFESASGGLASMAGHHLQESTEVRPGSDGSRSVRLYATSIFGVIANGTMTTGRMNAGAMSATDPQNNAYLDTSLTENDANGDPFYALMNGRPDSIAVWVRFTQGKANNDHPYATMSAAITDGTYYQDPEDKEYSNVIARAAYRTIATNDNQWQRISAPFSYLAADGQKAILVTLSTNADPGQGSSGDELLVDDIELIYNAQLENLKVKGVAVSGFDKDTYEYVLDVQGAVTTDDIEATANGAGAIVDKQIIPGNGATKAVITVTANDLTAKNTYTIMLNGVATEGIDVVAEQTGKQSVATYTTAGQLVNSTSRGNIYIEKRANGEAVKVIK